MPFVRFSRDKRGTEHIYLVHMPLSRRKSSRPRVLYWYRTPPGVKVGRQPFDEPVRHALEAQYPDLSFDWKAITEAKAPPPPEVEHWRERRRAERSAKQARAAEEPRAVSEGDRPESPPAVQVTTEVAALETIDATDAADATAADPLVAAPLVIAPLVTAPLVTAPLVTPPLVTAPLSQPAQPRSRRRRRGGRGRKRPSGGGADSPSTSSSPSSDPASGSVSAETVDTETET